MKSKSGFTLIEILVVVAVIAILTTVAVVANLKIQQNARDSKRRADIVTLSNELEKYFEKNGDYPRTCADGSYLCSGSSSVPLLLPTSLSQAQSILPGLPGDFGDPQYRSGAFLASNLGSGDRGYVYFGGTINKTGSDISNITTDSLTLSRPGVTTTCRYQIPLLKADQNTTYIVGYFSEYDNRFKLFQGSKGVQLVKLSGNATCDFLPIV